MNLTLPKPSPRAPALRPIEAMAECWKAKPRRAFEGIRRGLQRRKDLHPEGALSPIIYAVSQADLSSTGPAAPYAVKNRWLCPPRHPAAHTERPSGRFYESGTAGTREAFSRVARSERAPITKLSGGHPTGTDEGAWAQA